MINEMAASNANADAAVCTIDDVPRHDAGDDGHSLAILFGSESGTAERYVLPAAHVSITLACLLALPV